MSDIDTLLQPIPGEAPCGVDMVFSAEFDAIREARRHDDPHLDQGDWIIDIKEADWPQVIAICTGVLRERSKDVRVAAWLAEAWAKTRGFAGLRDGFLLVDGLCRGYWDGLHPVPDEGDVQQRVGNLAWLLSRSQQLIRELPLTQSEGGRYGAALWESATQLANAVKRAPQNAAELTRGKLTLEQFDAARRDTPPAFYSELEGSLQSCFAALDMLEATLTQRLGDEGPAFSPVREALKSVAELAHRFARDAGLLPRAETPAAPAAAAPAQPAATRLEPTLSPAEPQPAAPAAARGPLQTRDQALAQLREVAEFFRRTEPHSPVAYLADKAANWGEMSLHLWLRTVLKNDDALAGLEELLGVPKQPDGNG
ncbi:type VI secretion system protein TssA [Achromobacter pulmonis]|jgi:type VI secretion system protein ImpA|uniref:Type VI secretion system protein TssA n=1 Tax=Achromobacter pulmonis TaxID=1389932 RepID=A0A2N8KHQ3_9BURK|nr:type VI secretion system protein TssA [Achromobacter pulmonis]PND32982.1 type VI secretion system protein TssA [Achromobacter pulmonis]